MKVSRGTSVATELVPHQHRETPPPDASDSRINNGRGTVQALARDLKILGLFDAEHREWTLDGMIARTGMPRMTVYRLARTLRDADYLALDRSTGRYSLGTSMLAGVYMTETYDGLVAAARPHLEALADETCESATLAVLVHGRAISADMVRSRRPGRLPVAVGTEVGDLAGAHGKVFAAFSSQRDQRRPFRGSRERRTPDTQTDAGELELELARVRLEHVAYDMEEHDLGTCAVAAPVRDQVGAVVASVAVVVPTGRFDDDARALCTNAVCRAAQALSAYLGYSAGASA